MASQGSVARRPRPFVILEIRQLLIAWNIHETVNAAVPDSSAPTLPDPPSGYAERMPRIPEASSLVEVGPDYLGREAQLVPEAAAAWNLMRDAALDEGVELLLLSAFRSVARQTAIVAAKLAKGQTLDQILVVSAYPGFSEHHSGQAIDIGTSGARHFEEEFEATTAFAWLVVRARDFGFALSYPRDNPFGIAYEPWHWRHGGTSVP